MLEETEASEKDVSLQENSQQVDLAEEDIVDIKEDDESHIYSLGLVVSKPCFVLVLALIYLSHGLFIWGQVDELWEIYIEYGVEGSISLGATGSENPIALFFKNDSKTIELSSETEYSVGSFTYFESIYEMWIVDYPIVRFSAVLLVIFSLIWPHLKLIMLHIYFFLPVPSSARRNALYWLSTFGKFSLADVCVVCFMFAIFNIGIDYNLTTVYDNLVESIETFLEGFVNITKLSEGAQLELQKIDNYTEEHLGDLARTLMNANDTKLWDELLAAGCGAAIKQSCPVEHFPPKTYRLGLAEIVAKCLLQPNGCERCSCIVTETIYNQVVPQPIVDKVDATIEEVTGYIFATVLSLAKNFSFTSLVEVTGDASVGLVLTGYPPLVGFTLAVFFSIIASAVVDYLEDQKISQYHRVETIPKALASAGVDANKARWLYFSGMIDKAWIRGLVILAGCILLPLIGAGVAVEIFDWEIAGTIPEVLLKAPDNVDTYLSLWELTARINTAQTTGDAVFMVLFGILVIGFPILRACLLTVLVCVPLTPETQIRIAKMSDNVGAFIGWEPLFICVLLVGVEFPMVTEGIISDTECTNFQDLGPVQLAIANFNLMTAQCFVMYFAMLPAVSMLVIVWFVLVVLNSFTWKLILRNYVPFGEVADKGGPYCGCYCKCCKCCQS